MTNLISSHPATRKKVLDRARSIRRTLRKMREKLRTVKGAELDPLYRHNLYEDTEHVLRSLDYMFADLREARPISARRKRNGK